MVHIWTTSKWLAGTAKPGHHSLGIGVYPKLTARRGRAS
jgi:hypothetical protein